MLIMLLLLLVLVNEGSTPPVLQQFTQETMSIADCREHFYQPAMVADKMLCIKNYGQDSCQVYYNDKFSIIYLNL